MVRLNAEEGGRSRVDRFVTAPLETREQQEAALYRFDSRGYWIYREFLGLHQLEDARESLAQLHMAQDAWHEGQERALNIHLSPGFS